MNQHPSAARPLTLLYAALIVYASLYPFTGWRSQGLSPLAFLPAPLPKYWTWFDLITNFIGYAPFGFLLTLALPHWRRREAAALLAAVLAALLSLTMESLQSYLPQRVSSNVDLALNAAGGLTGALTAFVLERLGIIDQERRLRARWFGRESRGALVLLGLWPVGLLFPPPVAFGLGQALERLHEQLADLLEGTLFAPWLPDLPLLTPLGAGQELLCVALGVLAPCLLAHTIVRPPARRIALDAAVLVMGLAVAALSAALTWGPPHAWAWLSATVELALLLAALAALAAAFLPAPVCAALLALALLAQLALLNTTPLNAYAASTLQQWEQGRFIHFHGLAQWVGWLWPYVTLAYLPVRLRRQTTS
ncbi:MAG: VanZ family protein [Burkholderiaceae bacterium]|jgi:VanZ family protein|nr:VanZ family protein [Burkholderiaceae bacterium]